MKEEVTAYRKQQKEWGFLIVSGYFRLWVREWVREKIVIRIKDLIIRMPDANKLQRALVRW